MTKSELGYRFKEQIEICSSEQNEAGSYYPGILLAAIGRTQWLVQYKNRLDESGRPLVRVVDESEIRPEPPDVGKWRILVSDVVDGFVNGGWRVGRIVKKVEPNYYVKLDCDGSVYHLPWFRVRIHLDLVHGKWVCRKTADCRLYNIENEAKPIVVATVAENDTVECSVSAKLQGLEKLALSAADMNKRIKVTEKKHHGNKEGKKLYRVSSTFLRADADKVNLSGSMVEDLFQVLPSKQRFGTCIFNL